MNYEYLDVLNKCRICLQARHSMGLFYKHFSKNQLSVAKVLEKCFLIKIEERADLPKLICSNCELKVFEIYDFKLKFEKSEKFIHKCISEKLQASKQLKEEAIAVGVTREDSDSEYTIEYSPNDLQTLDEIAAGNIDELIGRNHSDSIKHKKLIKNTKVSVCKSCKAIFNTQKDLQAHAKKYSHYDKKSLRTRKNKLLFICERCGKEFTHKYKLNNHLNGVVSSCKCEQNPDKYKRRFSCKFCPKKFAAQLSLKTHLLVHTEQCEICSICHKCYPNQKLLQLHMQTIHTDKLQEKEYSCNVCGKQLSAKGTLKYHLASHTGSRKYYKCEICNKSFTQSGTLSFHMNIHKGEKPFACHVCPSAFAKPSNLQRHLDGHENIRRHECCICKKLFTSKHSLTSHTRIHTGEKPFECTVCSKKFSDKSGLNKHQKLHKSVTLIIQ